MGSAPAATSGDRDAARADRGLDLLGEPDAARPLRGLSHRPADLGGADRGRLGRLAGEHAAHRNRVGSLRRLGAAVHPASAFPEDFPADLPDNEVFGRGGAAIVEPAEGEIIAGPLYDREGIVTAECDLRTGLHAKRWFDSVGHYSREDVLLAEIGPRTCPRPPRADQDGSSSNSMSPTTTSSPGSKPAR